MDAHYLSETIRELDRYLQKKYLATLSLEEAALLLEKIESFNREAQESQRRFPRSSLETEYLIAVGCRLCSDLSDKILTRMIDISQEREQESHVLQLRIKDKLQQRYRADHLVRKAQKIRSMTNDTGHAAGLETIL